MPKRWPLLPIMLAGLLVAPIAPIAPAATASTPAAAAACTPSAAVPKQQFRAMWIASVTNIDWPSRTGLSAAAQQAELRGWLDLAVARRLNAVVLQVRPAADAFWPSPYEPWSRYLTGVQGRSPGYDPLAFAVAEAHARDLELHAWFNPYRAAMTDDPADLAPNHPARVNPGWRFAYGGKLYYNPGVPAVRDFVQDAMMDAVTRYDVDGVHFDDYFYPYPVSGESIADSGTFAQYGGGFSNIHDWRRDNVDRLVQELSQRIHAAKPHVKFGISPFGIWRNAATDPAGSATSGFQSYDSIYADSRTWVQRGWIDYVNPQIYWHIGFPVADYAVLTDWWADLVAPTAVHLYVGQAAYRAGDPAQDPAWQDPAELSDHLFHNRGRPAVRGDVYFSAKSVRTDRIGSISRLAADHYTRPAVVPAHGPTAAPAAPAITGATRAAGGVSLTWTGGGTGFAVYRLTGAAGACSFADATHLVGTTRSRTYLDPTAVAGTAYTYYVSALNRYHRESPVSTGRLVPAGGGGAILVDGPTTASTDWGVSTWSAQRHGVDYRFAAPAAVSDVAWFRATVPTAGAYRVEVWFPADPGYSGAAPHLVAAVGGNRTVTVDQRTGGGSWRSLGSFDLAAGAYNVVGVSRWTSATGYVIADAVRLTRL
jgi:uncharacterized lipoprotein YddW (UPF0748 family)